MPATMVPETKDQSEAPGARESSATAKIFLAPRVVDERAFQSFSTRLRELVGDAGRTEVSLGGVCEQGTGLLASLEALIHTQSVRAKEIRGALGEVEARIKELDARRAKAVQEAELIAGFEKRSAAQVAALTEASAAVVERAESAQRALESAVRDAREEADRASAREAELGPLVASCERATVAVRETATELDGLRQQSSQLLSAMRATILESAEARDAADSRLDRLGSLGKDAGSVLDSLAEQVKRAEQQRATTKVTPGEMDLDPIVREVSRRVMVALESRLETAFERHVPEKEHAGDGGIEESLAEIRGTLEMLSGVTLRLASTPASRFQKEIPAMGVVEPVGAPEDVRARDRRRTSLPLGASGEFGAAGQSVMVWSWTEGQP